MQQGADAAISRPSFDSLHKKRKQLHRIVCATCAICITCAAMAVSLSGSNGDWAARTWLEATGRKAAQGGRRANKCSPLLLMLLNTLPIETGNLKGASGHK
jgi:hypothetical protein